MAVNEHLLELLGVIFATHEDGDTECYVCMEKLHTLWDLVNTGADLHLLLPAIAEHLECCVECHEEYHAFMCIMEADQSGKLMTLFPLDSDMPSGDRQQPQT